MKTISEEEREGVTVYKSACRVCHGGCGALVHVKDGMVVKIEPDPESPLSRGRMCAKGLTSIDSLYHPDRLKYPMKRAGKRGEGKWERISWDEALDTIAEKLTAIRKESGPESIAVLQGTGRHHLHHTVRFASILGTPNWMEPGTAQCFFPRVLTGGITYGSLPTCDYYNKDVHPECILVWGHNPFVCNNDGESQFRFRDALKQGAKMICVDIRRTEAAEKADIWLQLRPGTDDALALTMLHIIIKEKLYDAEFVKNWTVGFDELAERVKECTPQWGEQITRVPAEKIEEAARLFATTKPAALEWGVALEQTPNCFQTVRSVALIPGITGNFDIPGGWIQGMHIMPDPQLCIEKIPQETQLKRLGYDRFKFLAGEGNKMPSAHIPSVLHAMKTGEPYRVRASLHFGNNGLLGFGNTKDVYESLMELDFMLCMDLYMTPTAELADIVLPAATWLEYDQLFSVPSLADHVILMTQKLAQIEECRPDEQVFYDIAKRMGLDYYANSVEAVFDEQLAETARRYPQFEGLNFQKLKKLGYVSVPIEYKKYEKDGFATASGKMEIASSALREFQYDPLPSYQEPPESPISDPETAKEYPLILSTGGRIANFFLSEARQISRLRRANPDPIVEINTQTAREYGIEDGDWVSIETKRGKIKQKAKVYDGIAPQVINCQHGWWFPENPNPDHGVWESNANVLTNNQAPYDPIIGTYQLRALLCRIAKA